MGISVIGGGGGGGGGLTDEGGTVVFSAFISTTSVISSTDLAPGSYFFTFSGTGVIKARSYDNTQLLGSTVIPSTNVTNKTTLKITIPNGIVGIYFLGTFSGSLIVQEIPELSPASVASSTWATYFDSNDYSLNAKIRNSNFLYNITGTNINLVDSATGATTSESIGYRSTGGSNFATFGNAEMLQTSSGAIIASGGYNGSSYNTYIKRRDPITSTWSTVATIPGIDYNRSIEELADGSLVVSAHWNGYGNRSYNYHVSTNDGVSWTSSTYPSLGGAPGRQYYVNGLYVVMVGRDGGDASQSVTNQYITSPDRVTWTYRTSILSFDVNQTAFFNGSLYVFGWSGGTNRFMRTSDGINWTEMTPHSGSFWALPNSFYTKGSVVQKDSEGNDLALWVGSPSQGRYYRISTSNAMTSYSAYTASPYSTTDNSATNPETINNGQDVILNAQSYQSSRFWLSQPTSLSISGMPTFGNAFPARQVFYSSQFDRWYIQDANNYWTFSDQGGDGTKYPNAIPSQVSYNSNMVEGDGFIAFVQYGYLFKSTNGSTFTKTAVYANTSADKVSLAYWNGILVYCENNYSNSYINVSTDAGSSWARYRVFNNNNYSNNWYPFSMSDGIALASSNNGSIAYTTDGSNWTINSSADLPPTNCYIPNGNSFSSIMITCSTSNGSYRRISGGVSSNASALTMPQSIYMQVVRMGSYFIASRSGANYSTTNYNVYFTSENGTVWTQRANLSSKTWQGPAGASEDTVVFVNANSNSSYGGYALNVQKLLETITIG